MARMTKEINSASQDEVSSYGDAGCNLSNLHYFPFLLRHEKYDNQHYHTIYLFDTESNKGNQVFIQIFPEPNGRPEYITTLSNYTSLKKNYKLSVQTNHFKEEFIQANHQNFKEHGVIQVKDGVSRFRLVYYFVGVFRSVILVLSTSEDHNFDEIGLFNYVKGNLVLLDKPVDFNLI
ncbi:hypothetical protein [Haliscomenobacter sp.]|uniref:hypothetical protein n=1 Tax=Haliscomenobacter sp. TaxID=2717303 RepID=UPI003593B047